MFRVPRLILDPKAETLGVPCDANIAKTRTKMTGIVVNLVSFILTLDLREIDPMRMPCIFRDLFARDLLRILLSDSGVSKDNSVVREDFTIERAYTSWSIQQCRCREGPGNGSPPPNARPVIEAVKRCANRTYVLCKRASDLGIRLAFSEPGKNESLAGRYSMVSILAHQDLRGSAATTMVARRGFVNPSIGVRATVADPTDRQSRVGARRLALTVAQQVRPALLRAL